MNTEVDEEIVNKIIKMVKTNEFEGGKTPEQKLMDRGVVIAELDNEETPSKEDPIECNVGSKSEEPKPVKVEEPVKMVESKSEVDNTKKVAKSDPESQNTPDDGYLDCTMLTKKPNYFVF